MIMHPRFAKPALTGLIVALALIGLAPALRAQAEPKVEPRLHENEKLERGRGRVFGKGVFRGLTPEDAKIAQDLLDKGAALEARGKGGSALGIYKRIFKKYPRSTAAPEAYYRTAKIQVQEGKIEKAFEAYDAIIRAYPEYGHFNELISAEYQIAYDLVKGRVRRKLLGVINLGANRERGIGYFERLVFNAPYSDYAPLSLMNIAEANLDMGELDNAIYTLDRLITNYPSSIVTSDAYLRMAQVQEKLVDGPLYDQGATQLSINNYEDYLILYPKETRVADAEQGLARMKQMLAESRLKIADFYYYKRERYQAAKVFYNEAITIAPNSEIAQNAREKLARLEVDEAAAQAKLAALAGRPQRNGFLGFFKKAKTLEPILPDDPTVNVEEESKKGAGTVQPGGVPPSSTVTPAKP
jgi:outer membrane protein assembly factor BamD